MESPPITNNPNDPPRGCSRNRLWWCLSSLPIMAIFGFIIHFVIIFRADNPYYSFDTITVKGFSSVYEKVTMNITGRVLNPNNDIDFYFLNGNSLTVSTYSDVQLCGGTFGVSFLGAKESASFQIVLRGSGLTPMESEVLKEEMKVEMIPLKFLWKLRVKIEGVAFKTWTVTRSVGCLVVVNRLNGKVVILSHTCG